MIFRLFIASAAVVALAIVLEVTARVVVGLGDPPLSAQDPDLEYHFVPGTYTYFGNSLTFNSFFMRSDEAPGDVHARSILVLGDSVINGGSHVDQSELATTQLQDALGEGVWVANISAGSWGPANLRAYFARFGCFNAKHIFVVLNGADLRDLPMFPSSLGPEFPNVKPRFALEEVFFRYLPRHLRQMHQALFSDFADRVDADKLAEAGGVQIVGLMEDLRGCAAPIDVLLHPTAGELQRGWGQSSRGIERLLIEDGARVTRMAERLNTSDFIDNIHLNAAGQSAYFRAMQGLIRVSKP